MVAPPVVSRRRTTDFSSSSRHSQFDVRSVRISQLRTFPRRYSVRKSVRIVVSDTLAEKRGAHAGLEASLLVSAGRTSG